MAETNEPASETSEANIQYVTLKVDGDWLVADLELLLKSVRKIYDAGLVAHLASPTERAARTFGRFELTPSREQAEEQASSSHEAVWLETRPIRWAAPGIAIATELRPDSYEGVIRSIAEHLPTLLPDARLKIRNIQMASPGVISLEGSGEPIKETGKLIERLTLLNQKRVAMRLANERAAQQNEQQTKLNELAIKREQLQLMEEYLRLLWGDDFRSQPGFQALIRDVLSGGTELLAMIESGRVLEVSNETAA